MEITFTSLGFFVFSGGDVLVPRYRECRLHKIESNVKKEERSKTTGIFHHPAACVIAAEVVRN